MSSGKKILSQVLARLRAEDLISGGFALALFLFAGFRSALTTLTITEEQYWDLALIPFPATLLIFIASVRYALGGQVRGALSEVGRILRDWLPFLLFLLAYGTFVSQIWYLLLPNDRDAGLLAWDRRLFGETPSIRLQSITSPMLTDVLTIAYFLHLILPPVFAWIWYRRDRRVFREFLLAFLLTATLATIGYVLVPAVGPGLAFANLFTRNLQGELSGPILSLMDIARAPRDVFPSLHVGASSIVLYYGARRGRAYFLVLLPLVLANWLSTLYLRYHYLVDVFAGWVLAILCILVARWLLRLEAEARKQHATQS